VQFISAISTGWSKRRGCYRIPPAKPVLILVATKTGARGVALLGIVVMATTFFVRLAIILFLSATRFMGDLIRGSIDKDGVK
jgi:hypothetical protein